jgi:hypothetical protein
LELNGKHQPLVFADNVNILNIKKNKDAILNTGKEIGLEANAERTKYIV